MEKDFLTLCKKAQEIINSTNNSSPSLLMVRLGISHSDAINILEQLKNPSDSNTQIESGLSFSDYDNLDGHSFEYFCAEILRYNGFTKIKVTQGSGDFGVDILCEYNGISYAIQCKCYSSSVGNKAVQEVFSGKAFYNCNKAVVITNNYFTAAAEETARLTDVELWDRHRLKELFLIAKNNGYTPKNKY